MGRLDRTRGIVRDETWRRRMWRTLSFSACFPFSFLFLFFDMKTLVSSCSGIVSQVAMGGQCEDGNPISIWTITLPSGLAAPLFQNDWLEELAIVFSTLGTGRGLMGLVHFSGIQLLWPVQVNTFKVGPWPKWVHVSHHACLLDYFPQFSRVFLIASSVAFTSAPLSHTVRLSVVMYDHESWGVSATCISTPSF